MSIETLLSRFGLVEKPKSPLEAQLHEMRREVARISRTLSGKAGHASEDLSETLGELGREAMRQGSHLAEVAGDQAKRGARAIRHDPLPAIAVVGTILLVSHLLRSTR